MEYKYTTAFKSKYTSYFRLWEIGAEIISNVVAAQTRLLRRKPGLEGSDSLITTIYGIGYQINTTICQEFTKHGSK